MTDDAPVEGQGVSSPEGQAPAAEGQKKATTTWYDGAPDEVVGYIQNKGWQESPLKAIDAYKNLEKFHGVPAEQLLKLPKDFDAEGALDPIYDRLGRPKEPKEYDFKLPDGVQRDEKRIQMFQEVAHKIGLNKKQAAALAEFDATYMQSIMKDYNESKDYAYEADMQKLKKEWGEEGFGERIELSKRAVRQFIPEGVNKEEALSKIEDAIGSAAMVKLFANAGERLFREEKIHDSVEGRPFGYTREQATADKQALMSELKADPARMANYNQGKGPDYDKMERLMKIIAG